METWHRLALLGDIIYNKTHRRERAKVDEHERIVRQEKIDAIRNWLGTKESIVTKMSKEHYVNDWEGGYYYFKFELYNIVDMSLQEQGDLSSMPPYLVYWLNTCRKVAMAYTPFHIGYNDALREISKIIKELN